MNGDYSSLADIVVQAARQFGSATALRRLGADDTYVDVSYTSLLERVDTAASVLARQGIGAGSHVAIMGENSPEWVVGAFAVLRLGAVLVPIDPKSTEAEYEHIVTAARAAALLVSPDRASALCSPALPVFVLGTKAQSYAALEGNGEAPPVENFPTRRHGDLALLVYTSGTTGVTKGVMLSHGNILTDLRGFAKRIPLDSSSPILSILPLSHMLEFNAGLLYSIARGTTITYLRSLTGSEILLNLQRSQSVDMICVPRVLQLLRNRIDARLRKLPPWKRQLMSVLAPLTRRWRALARFVYRELHRQFGGYLELFVVGGAPVHEELVAFFADKGFDVLQGYGLTETSPVLTANGFDDNRIGTAGRPIEGVELTIAGAPAEAGEILVRGPMVTKGYFENEAATAAAFEGGWFKTGDLGYLDETGALVICGRKKALIVTANGKNIYPEELETVFSRSSLLQEICVVAKKQDNKGERPYAFVVPDMEAVKERLGTEPTEQELRTVIDEELQHYARRLSDFKRLAGWQLHSEPLPKTPTEKVRRFLLQRLVDVPTGPLTTDDETTDEEDVGAEATVGHGRTLTTTDDVQTDGVQP